ncbi:MAG: ribose 5-phosphate isomerase B [Clostridia bacterium]|nr:ribose 5-phosphate isomerase B [Clostridia bacterium]
MKIAIGCDHGAFELKESLKKHFEDNGIEYIDVGTDSKASVHYPIYAKEVCRRVRSGEVKYGILLCSTGVGMSIAANKHKGIRAALCGDCYTAKFTRLHNDSNVLCMGALVTGTGLATQITDIFLSTEFEGGRHQTRVDMVMAIEEEQS